ncbi:hypothetical protein HF086_001655, partial [Spodoptera exigua]
NFTMSQRRTRQSNAEVDVSELEDGIKECVRYIICREGSKIPIKKGDVSKHLSATCQTPSNHVNTVLIEANKILKRVYGYKLVQVDAQSGVPYIVVLTEECESLPSPVIDVQHRTILIAALTHIFMTGAPIKEDMKVSNIFFIFYRKAFQREPEYWSEQYKNAHQDTEV